MVDLGSEKTERQKVIERINQDATQPVQEIKRLETIVKGQELEIDVPRYERGSALFHILNDDANLHPAEFEGTYFDLEYGDERKQAYLTRLDWEQRSLAGFEDDRLNELIEDYRNQILELDWTQLSDCEIFNNHFSSFKDRLKILSDASDEILVDRDYYSKKRDMVRKLLLNNRQN